MAWLILGSLRVVQVARSIVVMLWNRIQNNIRRRPGQGHPRTTIATDNRFIPLTTCRNRTDIATTKCSCKDSYSFQEDEGFHPNSL